MEKKDVNQEQGNEELVPLHLTSVQDVAMGVSCKAHTNSTQSWGKQLPRGASHQYERQSVVSVALWVVLPGWALLTAVGALD